MYGNSDRKEMLFIREARNLTTIKKNLSPLIRVRDSTMKFSMDIVFIQEYIRCFIIFLYTHADFDCKGLLLRTSYEKKILYITGNDFFSAKTAFLQLKLHSKYSRHSHAFFCTLCKMS
jgi:hypothetical protein